MTQRAEQPQIITYDSGWFAVAEANSYVKAHNLQSTKLLVKLYFATDINGADMFCVESRDGTNADGSQVVQITTTQLTVRTAVTKSAFETTAGGGASTHTTGFCRVIAVRIL